MLLGSIQGNMERGPPVGISGVYVGAGRQRASHGVNIVHVSSVNYWRIVFGIRAVVHHLRRSDLPEVQAQVTADFEIWATCWRQNGRKRGSTLRAVPWDGVYAISPVSRA